MIANKTLTAENDVIGPITVPRDHFVQAGVQYGAGGAGTIVLEGSLNDTDFVAVGMTPVGGGAVVTSAAAAGAWVADVSFFSKVRLRKSVAGGGDVLASLSLPSV